MLGLGGVDADITDNNAVSENAANLNGVAVDDANYLDYG
jgi:hypothetical protein